MQPVNLPAKHQDSDLFQVMHRLFWLRNLAISVQITTILIVQYWLGIFLPFEKLMVAISLLTLFNLFVYWRMRQDFPATELEIAVQLGFDSFLFAVLLYHTGGSTNPFVSLFLVPIALAATFLRLRYTIGIGLLCILLYSLMMINHHPLPSVHGRFGGDFNLHVIGMWVNFILSSVVVVMFISNLAMAARERGRRLAAHEQSLLRNEFVVSVGTLAAGTAHEISTPLSNIGMMADELADNPRDVELVSNFARDIRQQQQACVAQLDKLRDYAALANNQLSEKQPVTDFIDGEINRWSAMRPEIQVHKNLQLPALEIIPAQTLGQALGNLLNNAADASLANGASRIGVSAQIDNDNLCIDIDDYGQGFSEAQEAMAGRVAFSSKDSGLGLGLILSHASLEQFGGTLSLHRRDDGIRSHIVIPLQRISAT